MQGFLTAPICKGCKEEVVGFTVNGYCEDCLCTECGGTLDTETEQATTICTACEDDDNGRGDVGEDYCDTCQREGEDCECPDAEED